MSDTRALTVLLIICAAALVALLLISALSLHKKSQSRKLKPLVGAAGIVQKTLSPEGTILVNGELWPCRSNDFGKIEVGCNVEVIAVDEHLLVVMESNQVR